MSSISDDPVRLGVAGLGRAFMLMLPTFRNDARVRLVACTAPRETSRKTFTDDFGGRAHASVNDLAADPQVEAVYVATPHQMHREHVEAVLAAGKHVLLDKPLCVSMEDGIAIVEAARAADRCVIVGPSHSFDAQVLEARRLIAGGGYGPVRMIHAFNYTDFLYRPRRPEELVTEEGGGVIFSQGVHQIDIVRLLGGGMADSVRASTGRWDPARPTECAYAAHMTFAGGAFASLTYSGYAHFDSDEYCGWVGELGRDKDPANYGAARRALDGIASPEAEAALKTTRTYGAAAEDPAPAHNEHFGPLIVSCDRADLRLTPDGIHVYAHRDRSFLPVPVSAAPRRGVMDALVNAVRFGRAPTQDAAWALASLEVCHAIIASAAEGQDIKLRRQVPVSGGR